MGVATGVQVIGDYVTPATDKLRVQALINLIPDLDNPGHSGSIAGGGFLDEMSPAAAVQLRVELLALMTNVT